MNRLYIREVCVKLPSCLSSCGRYFRFVLYLTLSREDEVTPVADLTEASRLKLAAILQKIKKMQL